MTKLIGYSLLVVASAVLVGVQLALVVFIRFKTNIGKEFRSRPKNIGPAVVSLFCLAIGVVDVVYQRRTGGPEILIYLGAVLFVLGTCVLVTSIYHSVRRSR